VADITIGAATGRQITGAKFGVDQSFKVIDVSEKPLKPNVVRAGKQVPFVALNKNIVDALIAPDVIVQPGQAPRVVSQSIPAGTKVARGASVDLVLAPRSRIPGGVFAGGHAALAERNVDDIISGVLVNDTVLAAVLDFDDPAELPAQSRAAVEAALEGADIPIDDADPKQSFGAAFLSLKGAAAYR
jgi:hypothetical protein